MRLDKFLVTQRLAASACEARELIESGQVLINGSPALNAASQVSIDASVRLDAPERQWVSRGAYKLLKAIEYFKISVRGKVCIDIGASTGGFTDVLLSEGAGRVYAVDVGYGQLAWKLRNDPRVVVMERTNARFLNSEMFNGEKADMIVSDASFISLKLLLPPAQELLTSCGLIVALVKPQFEVSREEAQGGVVDSAALHVCVIEDMTSFIETQTKLELLGRTFSPIKGPEGNIEFLFLLGLKGQSGRKPDIIDAEALVEEAHRQTADKGGTQK